LFDVRVRVVVVVVVIVMAMMSGIKETECIGLFLSLLV
jgi:hypothetical protein